MNTYRPVVLPAVCCGRVLFKSAYYFLLFLSSPPSSLFLPFAPSFLHPFHPLHPLYSSTLFSPQVLETQAFDEHARELTAEQRSTLRHGCVPQLKSI